jgi:filamentous hemagglutinin family protein
VPCGPSGLVVVYGPENSVICANPNNLVAAGTYQLNTETLSLTSL